MAILMPDLTVEVYNADYRVLSAGSGLVHDPRALRTEAAGQVLVCAGRGASVIRVRAGGL